MKRTLAAALAATLALGAGAALASEQLAQQKGCLACHQVAKRVVGPAYQDVAKKYKADQQAPAKLAESILRGSQGKWGPIPMPPNKVTEAEAKQLAAWVASL